MIVFPAVDILGGRCVQLVQGKRETATSYGDPLLCAESWINQGAEALHIVNLDGAFGSSKLNAEKITDVIIRTGVETQLGGGIRSLDDARSWLDCGVDRIIISTFAADDPECLTILSEEYGSDRVMAGVDARAGEMVTHGWERPAGDFLEWADLFIRKGAGSLLYTNVSVEGLCNGIDPKPIRDLLSTVSVPVVVAGGITSPSDIKILKEADAAGVVLGSALYSGKITLQEALEAAG
ncbi:1-(5-phosphoribosyl)-5-[(5-phosphoribosylamino)methylideneamino]imidazole-4-carboxamide isomerase [Methanospirillum hungatei]|jgi:phosphoribosylformimino-5-aminoimidazole carboxamide ribotide isomerase|uniref:1-(5-phosphoribosyl)-5-[(5- phosphoribosylamino)methylideneamino]imidazole-4- carboxamide isomerase n=1 Tax=Methanospirillum hungatei TaxID=2203 RepID=UPI0009CDE328|nr:1-(5-phosphoribosyl)-5-[(5-phosphoribosylamino)methylideneamino]imidazole-4-carboxamide isomerase [Methanospirillum hungatei]MBP9008038.1 1-(5-phosphoribosyl)-5-[(5-phosphoribosylamino)methylideneamino]imidazole-4-carboxamide isomerase [Methanospirillum sp.]OQA59912.1 MAG: Imidazole glycerol phosphate synthase subunit HisF [Euryarchaeota archaeon ADurb.Bin294]HOW05040.1 1-(5-phosphoribosyl)-5-[(5-phosphoribosylamino)methylideneamino]imidazole-4-carboxamide isomerase [Methanospirillum hungatei